MEIEEQFTDRHTEGKYHALDKYGCDLTDMALQGKLEPVTKRSCEVDQLIEVLARKTGSPLLVGDSVDKFSVIQELVHRIVNGNVPDFLQKRKIVALDLGKLVAGAKYRGEFEERVEEVLTDIRKSEGKIIPYFDELWAGITDGDWDISLMLKFPLALGEFKCIAATVSKHVDYFRGKGLLARQFKIVSVNKTETSG